MPGWAKNFLNFCNAGQAVHWFWQNIGQSAWHYIWLMLASGTGMTVFAWAFQGSWVLPILIGLVSAGLLGLYIKIWNSTNAVMNRIEHEAKNRVAASDGLSERISRLELSIEQQKTQNSPSKEPIVTDKFLGIEYIREHAISKSNQEDGHGRKSGYWYVAHIKIVNNSPIALHNTSASIVSLVKHDEKFPTYLVGTVAIPFSLPFSSTEEPITLNPNQEKIVEIFHYHRYADNCEIRLGGKNGTTIGAEGGPFAIEIQATSQEGASEKAEFIMGLFGRSDGFMDHYFEPVFIPGMTRGQLRDKLITLCANGEHLKNEEIPTDPMRGIWEEKYEIWLLQLLQTAKWLDRELRHKILESAGNDWLGYQQALNVIPGVVSMTKAHLERIQEATNS